MIERANQIARQTNNPMLNQPYCPQQQVPLIMGANQPGAIYPQQQVMVQMQPLITQPQPPPYSPTPTYPQQPMTYVTPNVQPASQLGPGVNYPRQEYLPSREPSPIPPSNPEKPPLP